MTPSSRSPRGSRWREKTPRPARGLSGDYPRLSSIASRCAIGARAEAAAAPSPPSSSAATRDHAPPAQAPLDRARSPARRLCDADDRYRCSHLAVLLTGQLRFRSAEEVAAFNSNFGACDVFVVTYAEDAARWGGSLRHAAMLVLDPDDVPRTIEPLVANQVPPSTRHPTTDCPPPSAAADAIAAVDAIATADAIAAADGRQLPPRWPRRGRPSGTCCSVGCASGTRG